MKNKNKTIVEPKNGSLSKKIGRLAVIVVLYIAIVSTLAFVMSTLSLFVNADSINNTPDYQYLKTSYYNWDNITWYTDDNTYVTGSNDTFSTEITFNDYYAINDVDVQRVFKFNDVLTFPSFWDDSTSLVIGDNTTVPYGVLLNNLNTPIWQNVNRFRFSSNTFYLMTGPLSLSGVNYSFDSNSWSNDFIPMFYFPNFSYIEINNIDAYNWLISNGTFITNTSGNIINRSIVYNDSLSIIDTFVYDSVLNTDLTFNSIVFEKNNYFLKVGDLNRIGVPMISASVLNGGYNITFDIEGYRKDSEGKITNLSIVTNSRVDVLGYQFLYPSKTELFANIDNLTDNDMLYIKNLRVLVEFPNNYVDNLSYRYGVDSIEKNSLDYDIAFSSWVNQSSIANIGNDLLSSVNGFLAFELVPGLSLMSILILLVVIPLLIWILRLFLGG